MREVFTALKPKVSGLDGLLKLLLLSTIVYAKVPQQLLAALRMDNFHSFRTCDSTSDQKRGLFLMHLPNDGTVRHPSAIVTQP